MAGHTKSSSHEHSMVGFRQYLCKAYKSLVAIRHPDKKHSSSNKNQLTSFDEAWKELNDRNEMRGATNDLFHLMRSHKGNEFEANEFISYSPNKHNSNNQNTKSNHLKSTPSFFSRSSSPTPLSKKSNLFRSASHTIRTQTQTRLTRSLTKDSVDTKRLNNVDILKKSSSSHKLETKSFGLTKDSVDTNKPNNVDKLNKSNSSHKLETKTLGRSGSLGYSGPLSRSTSQIEIMYTNMDGLVKKLTVQQNLECSLEELCFGCVKRITVTRNSITNNGQIVKETETLSIKVEPGWTKGIKIEFKGIKNEEKGTHSCDVNFVITEKKHLLYRREGDDLELVVRISLLEALTGCTIPVPLLGGETMNLTFDEIILPSYEKIIEDQGMPRSKEQGQRGNLKLAFLVNFPKELTKDQKSEIVTILQDSC